LSAKLKQENVTGIILDLRRKWRAVSLEEAINLTGLFIPSGPVVQTRTMGRPCASRRRPAMGVTLYDGPPRRADQPLQRLGLRKSWQERCRTMAAPLIVGDTSTFGKGNRGKPWCRSPGSCSRKG